jgi:hypothetical protein
MPPDLRQVTLAMLERAAREQAGVGDAPSVELAGPAIGCA